jgi:translocator protein
VTPIRHRSASLVSTAIASLDARDVALGLAPLVAGTAVGIATNSRGSGWYRRLAKPSWTPPDAVFGPVWTVLYLLMGAASVGVVRADAQRSKGPAIGLYALQLALNLGWSTLFFGLRRPRPAVIELAVLWGSIAATIVAFARVRLAAGVLLLPYLAWTSFAGLLNVEIVRRNPDA